MSDFLKKGGLADEDTVVMNTQELEEKLRQAREAAIAEYSAAQSDPTEPAGDNDYIIAPHEDAELTVRDTLLQDFGIEEPEDEPELPEPEQPVQREQPAQHGRQPSEQAQRIIAEQIRDEKEKKKKRVIIICAAVALALGVMLAVVLLLLNSSHEKEYDELFSRGQSYFYDEEYDKALETLRQAMGINKTDECLLLMSECYEAKEDYVNAIAILKGASDTDTINKRIESLEKAKQEHDKGKTAEIGGEKYELDVTSIDLAGKGLKSSDMEELKKLTELKTLKLSKNSISDLDFLEDMTTLQSVDLSNNKVTDVSPLAKLSKLRTLHLDNNQIKDFTPLYSLSKLSTLTISGMDISEKQLKQLQKELPGCTIYSDEAKEDVTDVSLGGKTFKSNVTELDLSGLGISDISALSACTKLTKLDLSGNSVKDVTALMDMPELKWLDISDNKISDIRPLMSLSKLEHLDASGNKISSIAALSELTALKELYLKDNTPKSFTALSELSELTKLGLANTGLDDADLDKLYGLSKLKELDIKDNDGLTKKGVDALSKKLPKCNVSSSELKDTVSLGDKSFESDALTVDASSLGLSSISAVAGFSKVQTLNLANNKISDVSPLASLTALETLDLRNNSISDLSVLGSLSKLRILYLSGNPLTQEQIEHIRTALPNCTVVFE